MNKITIDISGHINFDYVTDIIDIKTLSDSIIVRKNRIFIQYQ